MKVVGINLVAILFFSFLLSLFNHVQKGEFGFMVALLSVLAFLINLLISNIMFSVEKKDFGRYFLVSAGVSLVVGASSCFAAFSNFRIH